MGESRSASSIRKSSVAGVLANMAIGEERSPSLGQETVQKRELSVPSVGASAGDFKRCLMFRCFLFCCISDQKDVTVTRGIT